MSMDLSQAWGSTAGKGTVAERIALVRAMTKNVQGPIHAEAVRKLWTEAGVLARAWVVANDPTASFEHRWHCKAAHDAIAGGYFTDFDANDVGQMARMQVYFGRLMAAGPEDDRVLTPALVAATLALAGTSREVPAFDPSEVDYERLLAAGLISEADLPKAEG